MAAATGVSARTLRYYEKAGLIEPVGRNAPALRGLLRLPAGPERDLCSEEGLRGPRAAPGCMRVASDIHDPRARRFLDRYRELSEPQEMVGELFAARVLVSDPNSSRCIPRHYLAAGIAQREVEMGAVGLIRTLLSDWSTVQLGAATLLVMTEWRLQFENAVSGNVEIALLSDYLLRQEGDGMRCIAYLARQDVAGELADHGLQ